MAIKKSTILAILFIMLLASCRRTETPAATAVPTPPANANTAPDSTQTEPPYRDAELPVAERVEDLLGQMSLAEKIGQMTLVEKNSIDADDVTTYFIGGVLSGGGGYFGDNTPQDWSEAITEYQQGALATPLGVPLLYGADAIHGHSNLNGAVIFPHNIGLGATRDAALVQEIGRVTAVETAATGVNWNYAPVLAVPQDIRWGRTYEGYGEETELVTTLGIAYLQGLQGNDLAAPDTVIGTPKHFVGDGGTTWGSSTTVIMTPYKLDQGVTDVDEATLRQIHLPPYQAAIDAGARSIMVSFSSWGGLKMHAQRYLLTDVLKEEMGFSGFLVSDWAGVDQISDNYAEAVVTAVNAGIDMNMVPYDYERFIDTLTDAVEAGDVSLARIDNAVRRILTVKFEAGLFENPLPDTSLQAQIGSEEHRQLARQAVQRSLVLLKNEGGLLPLSPDTATIFVAGEAADNLGLQSGGWTIEWQGVTRSLMLGTTILEGIEAAVSDQTTVHYNRFGNFERVTDETNNPLVADVGIVVVGEQPYAEGVGDSNELYLSEGDLNAIARTRAQSQKLVVILISGRPLIITEELPQWDAAVAAWLPGTEGAGVADALFGQAPFSGKLSVTWPRWMNQLPLNLHNADGSGCDAPLFPFGYGLTTEDDAGWQQPDCPPPS